MEKLNNTTDLEKYIQFGDLITPFLNDEYIKEKVMLYYKHKIKMGEEISIIKSLTKLIKLKLRYSHNGKFKRENKFNRSVKEIWESGLTTGCTDYAMVFACFARQLGYPCAILRTANENWLKKFFEKKDYGAHAGHAFCEVFFENKWILVDPTCNKITEDYDCEKIQLEYNVGDSNVYYPYVRSVNMVKEGIEKHLNDMEELCKEIII